MINFLFRQLRKSDIVAQYGYELIKSGVTGPDGKARLRFSTW